jgi:hypothetical protein
VSPRDRKRRAESHEGGAGITFTEELRRFDERGVGG